MKSKKKTTPRRWKSSIRSSCMLRTPRGQELFYEKIRKPSIPLERVDQTENATATVWRFHARQAKPPQRGCRNYRSTSKTAPRGDKNINAQRHPDQNSSQKDSPERPPEHARTIPRTALRAIPRTVAMTVPKTRPHSCWTSKRATLLRIHCIDDPLCCCSTCMSLYSDRYTLVYIYIYTRDDPHMKCAEVKMDWARVGQDMQL
jgi:hypothetical protein